MQCICSLVLETSRLRDKQDTIHTTCTDQRVTPPPPDTPDITTGNAGGTAAVTHPQPLQPTELNYRCWGCKCPALFTDRYLLGRGDHNKINNPALDATGHNSEQASKHVRTNTRTFVTAQETFERT